MTITTIFISAVKRLVRTARLYGGQRIRGLHDYSRCEAGNNRANLNEIVPPEHPSASKVANLDSLSPKEVRQLLRRTIRLQEVDPARIIEAKLAGEQKCPWSSNPVGDRHYLRKRSDIPFIIMVSRKQFEPQRAVFPVLLTGQPGSTFSEEATGFYQKWDRLNDIQKEALLRLLFSKMNADLKYLSGGKFSLKLQQIVFVDNWQEQDVPKYNGFTMVIRYDYEIGDGGYYFRQGRFWISPDRITAPGSDKLCSGTSIHELMHGLISRGHAETIDGRRLQQSVFNLSRGASIGLNPEEAAFLGWPSVPPRSSVINIIP